jgi:hypothetical protein
MAKYPLLIRPITLPPYWKDVSASTSGEALTIADTIFTSGDVIQKKDSITKIPGEFITAIQIYNPK